MFRTIFGKQLTLYLGVLIISFGVLGLVLSHVIKNYLTEQRVAVLTDTGEKVAADLGDFYEFGMVQIQVLVDQYQKIQPYLNLSIIILNTDMTVFVSSHDVTLKKDTVFDQPGLRSLSQGDHVLLRDGLPGYSQGNDSIIVGYPAKNKGRLVAYALVISSMEGLNKTIWDIYKYIGLGLSASAAVGFILIYLFSRHISKPLRQMNEAAKQIAGGSYEKRISVKGRDEVSQLADSLNNMAESLEHQERSRREFIANISHDLRSPLTSIRGFIQAIRDGAAPPSQITRYLDIVLNESDRLSKLANDIVDLSQSEAGQTVLEMSVFDINRTIRDTVMLYEAQIIKKQLKFRFNFADSQNLVYADYEKIRRVIYNLLDNAIKFTPEGGSIIIDTSPKEGRVWVTVRDSGVGINAEDQKLIFDRFYKADASRGLDKMGLGVGLAIVKEFTRAHGYPVTLVSAPGKGSAFTFSLDEGKI